MSKRFIDTGIFDDDWFMDLSKDAKILWLYFLTKCDHAGILKLNVKLCQLQTGIKDLETVKQQLGNRCITVGEQLFFIPKFVKYQYPGFPNCNFLMAKSAISILEKYGLIKDSQLTVGEELVNSHSNGIGNGNGNIPAKKIVYSEFYDSEIEKSGNNENYVRVIKMLFGDNNLGIPMSVLLKMPTQLSWDQFQKLWFLKEKFGFSFGNIFERMQNWGNPKKNTTIYSTFLTFAKNDNPKIRVK